MPKGIFIVLEGPDRSGKSTQADLLARALRKNKIPVLHTREPGGTPFAEAIRKILLDPNHQVAPLAELLLYEAARAQHTFEKIRPGLERGDVVISERYTLATLAYQGFGRQIPLPLIQEMNHAATSNLEADITFLLDIPIEEFTSRSKSRGDRIEREDSSFRMRVREGYRALATQNPKIIVIPAIGDPRKIHAQILKHLEPILQGLGVRG
ncbi:MAG: dTMP kinase [Elusimicrobia bacterium]|nr:dTMP kinase [Elusimicrobiota bacterium]